ncbi:transposase, partial [Microcoleus sp. S28C3]|uniref:transposase n=1 Tax=Microcoleus sp. S28C3 TaxID=3055414 RepID=UPI002FD5652B
RMLFSEKDSRTNMIFCQLNLDAFTLIIIPVLMRNSLVMDNCPIHLGEEVKKALEKKRTKLIYLSPYSPDFSPIENLWSKLKIILRSIQTTNYQELGKALLVCVWVCVTSSNIFNWFTHCCYCTSSF